MNSIISLKFSILILVFYLVIGFFLEPIPRIGSLPELFILFGMFFILLFFLFSLKDPESKYFSRNYNLLWTLYLLFEIIQSIVYKKSVFSLLSPLFFKTLTEIYFIIYMVTIKNKKLDFYISIGKLKSVTKNNFKIYLKSISIFIMIIILTLLVFIIIGGKAIFILENTILDKALNLSGLSLDVLSISSLVNYKINEEYSFFVDFLNILQKIAIFFMLLTFVLPRYSEIKHSIVNKKRRVNILLIFRNLLKSSIYFYILLTIIKTTIIHVNAEYLNFDNSIISDASLTSKMLLKDVIINVLLFIFLLSVLSYKTRKVIKNKNISLIFMLLIVITIMFWADSLIAKFSQYINIILINTMPFLCIYIIFKIVEKIINLNNYNLFVILFIELYFGSYLMYFDKSTIFAEYFLFSFFLNLLLSKKYLVVSQKYKEIFNKLLLKNRTQ